MEIKSVLSVCSLIFRHLIFVICNWIRIRTIPNYYLNNPHNHCYWSILFNINLSFINAWGNSFKGTVPRDFRLPIFFMNRFPQAPENTIRAVSYFFENSRRYSQLKVDHQRWQMKKSSIRKILLILLGHLWIVELTYI